MLTAGCTTTRIDVPNKANAEWQSTGDTSRTLIDCRKGDATAEGALRNCLIYIETTESEDIAPIVDSIVDSLPGLL